MKNPINKQFEMRILKFIDCVTDKSFVVKSGSVFPSLCSALVAGLYQCPLSADELPDGGAAVLGLLPGSGMCV